VAVTVRDLLEHVLEDDTALLPVRPRRVGTWQTGIEEAEVRLLPLHLLQGPLPFVPLFTAGLSSS
jgi:hypothetical protein